MKRFFKLAATVFFIFLSRPDEASAQKFSIGTNAVDWVNHGTASLNMNVSLGAHLTMGVSGRYNPWFFKQGTDDQVNHALRGGAVDFRYWPWHVYSGWWVMLKGQALEYNYGNLYGGRFSEQGKAFGGGLGAGYALMLGKHWNVDFGLALWGGRKDYRKYDCAHCGMPLQSGEAWFILLDNVFVSFCYIF